MTIDFMRLSRLQDARILSAKLFSVAAIACVLIVTSTSAGERTTANHVVAGFSRVDITPPVGCRMAGNYFESLSVGVDDPLHARVMYLSDGTPGSDGLVVTLDLCAIGREASDPIRKAVVAKTGVPYERIIISATHNHAGPDYYGAIRDYLHQQALDANNGVDPAEKVDYIAMLVDRVSDAARIAVDGAAPVVVRSGETIVNGLAFNRRFHMSDGTVKTNPGVKNPGIVRVAGPIDPRLPVVWVESRGSGSQPLGLFTTFALHTATYGDLTRIGADFPGVLDRRMQAKHGRSFVAMFGEGTAGDINHIDVTRPKPDRWKVYEMIGNRLADAIDDLQPQLREVVNPKVSWGRRVVQIPLAEVDEELAERAPEILFAPKGEQAFLDRVAAWKAMNTKRLRERDGDSLIVELQAVTIGDELAIIAMPNEVFVELGMMIRDSSPFPVTAVLTMSQDVNCYVPTEKAFSEGSYEVTNTSYLPGGGETMANAAVDLLVELSRR